MGYAKHVGRVGALAVALGIGAAVATTPGVAWADGTADDNPPAADGGTGNTGSPDTATPPSERNDPGEAIRKSIERAADDLRDGIRKAVTGVVRSSGGAITSTHRTPTNGNVSQTTDEDEKDQSEKPQPKSESQTFVANGNDAPNTAIPRWQSPVRPVVVKPVEEPIVKPLEKPAAKVVDEVKAVVQQSVTTLQERHQPSGTTNLQPNAVSTLDNPPTENAPTVRTPFVAPIGLVTNVLDAALAPFLNTTPNQPAPQNPILWAVLGWVRRQVQDTPFGKIVLNRAPVAAEEPEFNQVDGTDNIRVSGFATDPDGDDLETVGVTDGAHGSVRINDDGSVTYDPDAGYTGVDTFTVTVSDEASGFHLHGLSGIFQPDGGHTTTVNVTVSVAAEEQGVVDEETGKVTTEQTVDTSKLPHPETLVGTKYPTQYGEVEITAYDPVSEKYTMVFTPDANLRVGNFSAAPAPQQANTFSLMSSRMNTFAAAAPLGPPTYEDVTITVGEAPNQQTFAFRVPITPARLRTDPDAITVQGGPGPMAVSGDKLYVLNGGGAFGNSASTLSVIDTTTNTAVGAPIQLPDKATDIVASGNRVYIRSASGITVYDTATNTFVDTDTSTPDVDPIPVTSGLNSLFPGGMAIQGNKLYAVSSANTISVVDLDTDTVEATPITVSGAQAIYGETISGDKLYVSDISGKSVRAVSIAPGADYGQQVGPTIQLGDTPSTIIASPPGADNSYVYVATPLSNRIVVIDPTDNHVVGSVPMGSSQFGYTSFAFSPDGTLLYAAGSDTISVIDTSTNQLVLTTAADSTPDAFPTFVAASPDNAHIYFTDTFATYPPTSGAEDAFNDKVGVVSFYVGADEVPPAIEDFDDPTSDDADPSSGAVSVVVHADDEDGDALSVTVTQAPQHGTVVIAPGAGGTYTVTYVPDGQSRLDAYDGAGDTTDQFVITVSDGQQSVSKVVNVPVDGAEAAVTNVTSVGDSFEFPRAVAFDANGNPIYTVSRPADLGDLSSGGVVSLILADGNTVDVYNTAGVGPTLTAPEDLAVDSQGVVYVADPTTGTVAKFNGGASAGSVDVHGDPIGLFTTPEGNVYAVVGSTDETTFERVVSIYDVTNDAAVGTAYSGSDESKEKLVDVAMTSAGVIYVTNPSDGTVSVVGSSTPIDVGGTPTAIAIDPTNDRVFVTVNHVNGSGSSATGTLELVEITGGTAHHVTDLYTSAPGQASLNDGSDMAVKGNRIYVTNVGVSSTGVAAGSLSVVDADTGTLLDPISFGSNPYAQVPTRVAFSPDGNHAYVVSAYGVVSEISFAQTADNAVSV